ncbi:MAG: beta-ketoacyl-[acyl-carrier-protein] synthase family protein [Desulfurivibrionaceae bacterium]|nr:beta-ketoacyl-[acyl-carrier-protein] synthase family protein [Desulfobulbales bacterium]MDT8334632.1 beta-ketoacyl-[acyl-carrier-protein] synthase family protein [Desulfurivibrionaceae bacterium]
MLAGANRVAITGMGIVSCLGLNRDEVKQALLEGRCGLEFLPERKKLGFQSGLSGVIKNFDSKKILDRKKRKTLPEFGLWAWTAIEEALDQAGLEPDILHGDVETGMVFGNDSSAVTAVEQVDILRKTGETRSIGSGHIFRLLNSTVTLNIGTILGLHGQVWTVSGACASGAMAIGQGAELIAAGRQKRVICGGAQEISWQSMCSFDTLAAFSRRENDPPSASRPFDRDRDGLVPSGGAATVILESYEEAENRGAVILGEVMGYGNTSDGHHIVIPSGEGLERAMRQAIADAGLNHADIDLVLAHATSTPAGDEAEGRALANIFKPSSTGPGPLITATKALTGHEFWMAGASQVIYGMLMAEDKFVVGNRNLENPDNSIKNLRLPTRNVYTNSLFLLCNAAGFGGTNASLVIKNHR